MDEQYIHRVYEDEFLPLLRLVKLKPNRISIMNVLCYIHMLQASYLLRSLQPGFVRLISTTGMNIRKAEQPYPLCVSPTAESLQPC